MTPRLCIIGSPLHYGIGPPIPRLLSCPLLGMLIPAVASLATLAFYLWTDECVDYANDEADYGDDDGDQDYDVSYGDEAMSSEASG